MRPIRLIGAIAAAALLLAASACGGDEGESEEDIKRDLSETLQRTAEDFEDEKVADCFADIVIEVVGIEELKDLELSADEPADAELEEQIADAAVRARDECTAEDASG